MPPGPVNRIFLHKSKGCFFFTAYLPDPRKLWELWVNMQSCRIWFIFFAHSLSWTSGVWTFISGGGVPAAGNRRRQGGQEDKQDTLSSTLSLFTLPSSCWYHLCQSMLPKGSMRFSMYMHSKCIWLIHFSSYDFGIRGSLRDYD